MLQVDDPIKMLGTVRFGVPVNFKYRITNKYSVVVSIEKLVVECASCTKASIDKWDLQPGEFVDVLVTFTPGSTGFQSKKINVIYSTGHIERPPVILQIKAKSE